MLTLKAPFTTAADDIHKYFFHCFPEKIRLDVSRESSARQRIHLKHQALFSSKDKSKKLKCRLLQILFGALRINGLVTFHAWSYFQYHRRTLNMISLEHTGRFEFIKSKKEHS